MLKRIISFTRDFRYWVLGKNQPSIRFLDDCNYLPLLLFVFCVVFYCIYLLLMQPEWVTAGEMWAEMATNYFPNSSSPSIFVRLFSTDSGYIPLPQRIIALVGDLLKLPVSVIPYFYTWAAILVTGAMIGAFCLQPFRSVIKNDLLRFLVAVAVLLIADFETRTFINFTYFVAFFAAIVTALAFTEESNEVPWWSWFIPILMISKPAVLSALPAMILVALVSKTRFKLIVLTAVVLLLFQLISMFLSHSTGTFAASNNFGLFDKIFASVKYFIGFLGAYSFGKNVSAEFYRPLWFGLCIFLVSLIILLKRRTNASSLILVGLSLLYFNVFINSFALSDSWNINMKMLPGVPVYRHIIVGYFGVVLVVGGMVSSVLGEKKLTVHSFSGGAGPVVFLLWFVFSGWLDYAGSLNKAPGFPVIFNSYWQKMASTIDSGESVCIPVDPLGWMFERNCAQLNPEVNWGKPFRFESIQRQNGESTMTIEPLPSIVGKNLISLAVLLQPQTVQSIVVSGKAVLNLKNGGAKYLVGDREFYSVRGLLLLTAKGATPISDIKSITLKFDMPVDVGFVANESSNKPGIIWMGY